MNNKKLGLTPLVFLIIGSMVGAGIFGLPAEMAGNASPGAMLIGWLITGIGMIALVLVYQNLSIRRPDLNSGVFSYARAGFGDYVGFNSAWGYWISAILSNVAYCLAILNVLEFFFPGLRSNQPVIAFLCGSAIIWVVQFLILRGVKQASIINVVVQIAKIIPILLFLTVLMFVFNFNTFTIAFWGEGLAFGSIVDQVRNTMLVTLWVFIGVEGAVVVSERAKKRKDIGRATIIALLSALLIYIMVSMLALGHMSQTEIMYMEHPSMAYVLGYIVGPWGAAIINLGLLISVSGAFLGWTILASEVLFVAAKEKLMPKFFTKENSCGTPVTSLITTIILLQLLFIFAFISEGTYQIFYFISSTAILLPYLLSGLYGFKLAYSKETYIENPHGRRKDLIFGVLSSVYAFWLVYAAGVNYILLVTIFYAPGLILYIKVQKENDKKLFSGPIEVALAVLLSCAGVAAVILMTIGVISN